MDPVDPKMLRRFLKLLPSRLFSSVFLSDASELTGADGSIHPSPFPWDPDEAITYLAVDEAEEVVVACLLRLTKADAVPAQRADVAAKVSATLLIVVAVFVVAVQGGPVLSQRSRTHTRSPVMAAPKNKAQR
jgi:hypothetical protein